MLPGGGGEDGIIDQDVGVPDGLAHAQGVGAKSQVVVPGEDGELPLLLVKEVVVAGVAQVTVPVHQKHLAHKIPQRTVHVYGLFQVFAAVQIFQRLDEPPLVRLSGRKFGVVENARVALRVIVDVAQVHVMVFVGKEPVIGLIELAVVYAEIPPGKGLLRLFHRQEQAPGLPVHRHPCETAQGRRHAQKVHDVIGQVGFQVAVVLEGGVQGELVQAVIAAPLPVVVELQLQAVAGKAVFFGQPQGVVPLGPQPHLAKGFPIDLHRGGNVRLLRGASQEGFPILHPQVDGVDPSLVKQPGDVPRVFLRRQEQPGIPPRPQQQTEKHSQGRRPQAQLIPML